MKCKKFVFILLFVFSSLSAGVYLERPADFGPKIATVAGCFLCHQDKVLLLHRQDHTSEPNCWAIPGGKLNKNEPIIEGIQREVFEETGYQLEKEKIHYIGKLFIKVPNFDFEYHMVKYEDEIENPGDVKINFMEHKGFTWVSPKDALKMDLMTDEDTCFQIVFGL